MSAQSPFPSSPEPSELRSLCLALTEHMPLATALVVGPAHIVGYANPAFCELMGSSLDEMVGKRLAEKIPEKSKWLTLLGRVFQTGKAECRIVQERSDPRSALRSYTLWPVMSGEFAIGVMIQIIEAPPLQQKTMEINEALILSSLRQHELAEEADTANANLLSEILERKQAEKSLHAAQALLTDRAGQLEELVAERTEELTSTNHQLDAFVYSIAHDLRSPLRSMQGFASLLIEEAAETLTEDCKNYAERISHSAQLMDSLLTDMLAFSRISHKLVVLAPVNLSAPVEAVLFRLQKEIEEKHAQIESIGPWPFVLAHGPTLTQILFNLVENALKFVRPTEASKIRLLTEERSGFIRFWVEDNGVGIAPAHQEQIFRLFARLHGEEYPGTGIGLALVQKGIERMGGKSGVESNLPEGSRFWFELRKA